jgi:transcriptional regulator with XRE-family HTH domain
MDIGKRIRELREEQGITVTELAKRSGLARNSLSLIELGNRTPGAATIEKIARGLTVEPGELFVSEADAVPLATAGVEDVLTPGERSAEIAFLKAARLAVTLGKQYVESFRSHSEAATRAETLDEMFWDAYPLALHFYEVLSHSGTISREAQEAKARLDEETARVCQLAWQIVHGEEELLAERDRSRGPAREDQEYRGTSSA